MIRSSIRMIIPPEKQDEALEILGSIIEEIELETGCLGCRLYKGVKDERSIMLEEFWNSEDDVRRHLRSKKYNIVLMVIEMASEFPEIRFDMISDSKGVQTIEDFRS